jgi:hypothetical protein
VRQELSRCVVRLSFLSLTESRGSDHVPLAVGGGIHLRQESIPRAGRKVRGATTLALATTHHDLVALEVNLLHVDGQRFEESEAAMIQYLGEEVEWGLQVAEERKDLAAREDRREVMRPAGRLQIEELGQVQATRR